MKKIKPSPDMHPWARLIHQEMQKQGLNSSQLAELSGVSRHTIYHWFTRCHQPGVTSVNDVLQALGYELRAFPVPLLPSVQRIRQRQLDRRLELNEEISRRNRLGLMGAKYVLSVTGVHSARAGDEGIRADAVPALEEFDKSRRRRDSDAGEASH